MLARQRCQNIVKPFEIGFGSAQPQFGFVAAGMNAADPRGLIEQQTAFGRPRQNQLGDLPLRDHRRRAGAGRGIGKEQLDIARPRLAAVDPVVRALGPLDAPAHVELDLAAGRSALSSPRSARAVAQHRRHPVRAVRRREIATSASVRAGRPVQPPKMTSSISPARICRAELSPMTQRSASTRFDLPHPFGPTIPVSPGAMTSSAGSTNDLKPDRRSLVNCSTFGAVC